MGGGGPEELDLVFEGDGKAEMIGYGQCGLERSECSSNTYTNRVNWKNVIKMLGPRA